MRLVEKNVLQCLLFIVVFLALFVEVKGVTLPNPFDDEWVNMVMDTIPIKDRTGDFINDPLSNPFDLHSNEIKQTIEYDPITNQYIIIEKIGDEYYRTPTYMTFQEYLDYKAKEQERRYFNTLAGIQSDKKSASGKIDPMDKIDLGTSLVDRLFGGSEVNIQPQGSVDLSMGWLYSRREDPALPIRAQRQSQIDFQTPLIRMSVDGAIGKKLNLDFNYDTQSTFDFDRQIKLGYDADAFSEDDIIKKLEVGNVSMPLRSNLITGAQSLFGIKTELQFGRLRLTGLLSQQRSRANNLRIENGTSVQDFELYPDDYDENRHFFISHYNRNTFERSLRNIPFINTSFQIAQIEVWISDDRPEYQDNSTMVAAISDLAESDPDKFTSNPAFAGINCRSTDETGLCLPNNNANNIYGKIIRDDDIVDIDKVNSKLRGEFGFRQTFDYEVFRGRKLSPSEFTYNPKLGYISLNFRMRPNQVLAVAYNYYYTANLDTIYQVGQLSASSVQPGDQTDTTKIEPPKVIFTKLLKSTNQITTSPMWDLMMKNVYPLRTTQLSKEDFEFDIFYEDDFDDGSLKKYIPEPSLRNFPLLQIFNLDKLNRYSDPQPDGYFDYLPGITVVERSGSIVFPVLEPFGSSLDSLIKDSQLAEIYKFQALYDTTISIARQSVQQNKFVMKGRVKSSSNNGEIQLGPFVPEGSVRVRAGGRELIEGQDYEIDYSLGRLRIINEAFLAQGTPVDVSFEDNSLFSLQQKQMMGLRAEYQFNKKSSLGATFMRLYERPFQQKVNVGDDPIDNKVLGIDYNLDTDVPWVTRMLDKLPFYSTKEPSTLNVTAEAAVIIPGHYDAINIQSDDPDIEETSGISNIDDFEGAVTPFNLGGFNANAWTLASTPVEFKESQTENDLSYGANRARLNWYVLDLGMTRSAADNTDPYTRLIDQRELFTNRQVQPGQQQLFTFDVSYYPQERGPYNFETRNGYPGISNGFSIRDDKILLNNPVSRWGGLMRYFQNADFEAANYEFIEFWMLNPFMDRRDGEAHLAGEEGEMVFNLGSISEDIIRDNYLFFENAIPTTQRVVPTTNTAYGRATISIPLVNGFDLQEGQFQDLGFDGMTDQDEQVKYQSWLVENGLTNIVDVVGDPSNDNFKFFNDPSFNNVDNLLVKMKDFNGPQGNAPLDNGNQNQFVRGNRYPDTEDLNNNKSLDQADAYYEYRIRLRNLNGELDTLNANYYRQTQIIDKGNGVSEKWYRFQIPINAKDKANINGIVGFRAIQFMRMYFTKFSSAKTFRLAEFQIMRSQWRRQDPICIGTDANPNFQFSIDDVGVEENSGKTPFNYIVPPGIQRVRGFNTFANLLQDEKSMILQFRDMSPKCEVGISKLARLNFSLYKRLQMFVHAEHDQTKPIIPDKNLAIFVRIGKDFVNNYYEYVLPLTMSKVTEGQSAANVWPRANFINIPLDSLIELKRIRITQNLPNGEIFGLPINDEKGDSIKLIGNPSLGLVKVIQVGVRNIADNTEVYSGEVWINELRLTGFDESGGVAAQTRMQLKLADLGEMNFSANYSSIGYGALDKRLLERNQSETFNYDIGTSLDIGKLLPKSLKLTVPVYAQYSKTYVTPRFDPFDLDVEVDEKLALIEDPLLRDTIRQRAREEVTITTFNLTNVKTNAGGTGKPWSPSNVSVSYAYTKNLRSDPIIQSDDNTEQMLGLDYVFARKSSYIEPFKFIKVKALKFLTDFNFSLIPSNFSFSSRMNSQTNYRTFRLPDVPVFRFDDLRFSWDRNYVLDWDLTKSLRLNFRANSTSLIDQLRQVGIADNVEDRLWYNERGEDFTGRVIDEPNTVNDYRNNNIRRLGRNKNYTHNLTLNYKIPFKSIPLMDWVTGNADYRANYGFDAGPLIEIDNLGNPLGNVITNGQNMGVNVTLGFDKLYNKSGYLKAIETGKVPRRNARSSNQRRRINSNKSGGTEAELKPDGTAENKDKKDKEAEEKQPRLPSTIERILIRPLLMLRSFKINYKEEYATVIPGFLPQSQLLGQSSGFTAPGWDFIAGVQPRLTGDNNWLLSNQSWFNPSPVFNDNLSQNKRVLADVKLLVEPFKDFSIDITMNRNFQEQHTEVFRNIRGEFTQLARYDVGSFDASYIALNTLFKNSFELYNQFKVNREIISSRLPNVTNPGQHPDDNNFAFGYGPTSNRVVVPAFLAAYTNRSAVDIELDQYAVVSDKSYIPRPNWQFNYNGLTKLKPFKGVFTNFTIKHGYRSNIRINRFESQPQYNEADPFLELSPNENYFSRIEIPAVMISEQFTPLIGVSIKTVKDMKIDFEYKASRALDLSPSQLRENKSSEIVLGAGYVIKDFKGFKKKKKKRRAKTDQEEEDNQNKSGSPQPRLNQGPGSQGVTGSNDLRFNLTFSIRDDLSQIYDLLTGINGQADRGSRATSFNPTIEYDVNKNLSLRFYFDYTRVVPKTTISFPITTIRSGLTFRFNIN